MTAITALIMRELRLGLHQGGLGTAIGFLLALIVLVPLSLGPDLALLSRIAPGIMWLGLLLAVLLTSEQIFQQDFEDGSLDLMTMTATPFEFIVLAKAMAHWVTVSLPLAILAPPLGLMLNLDVSQMPTIWAAMILGSYALSMLAAIGGAVTAGLRRGSLLVALLILPLYVPVLIFGIAASTSSLAPETALPSFLVLLAITLMTFVISPLACAAALKAYLR
jgi:heme exporter protein B